MPIAVFGSLNHDQVTRTRKFPQPGETVIGESFQSHLGGKGFNEAIACAKLSNPNVDKFTVSLFGCIGNDVIKDKFLSYLNDFKVKTDNLTVLDNVSTGTATIIVQEEEYDDDDGDDNNNNVSNGENRIIITRGANKYFDPSLDVLDEFFNASNFMELNESIDDVTLPSNLHAHATRPLNNEEMAKTEDINPHPPSNIHSHGSMASLANISNNSGSSDALVYKNGNLIHGWSASGTNLSKDYNNSSNADFHSHTTKPISNNNEVSSRGSFVHSHKVNDIMSSKITGSYKSSDSIPSDLHSHASSTRLETSTYPSPKPSSVDLPKINSRINFSPSPLAVSERERKPSVSLGTRPTSNLNLTAQQRLTNVSFSLGGTSAHSSAVSLTPSQSYILNNLQRAHHPQATRNVKPQNDLKYTAILQNEIPNPHKIIQHLSSKYPNVEIFYNPSPLPNKKSGYNEELLTSLHDSHFIVINETELANLVKNFHANPTRDPLTLLKNTSNYEPNHEYVDTVNTNIKLLSKLRTIITKPVLVVTLGEYGVLYSDRGQFNYAYVPSEDVGEKVVDTTGAGDTFLGAIVTCLYRGEELENSIKFATRASAECIKRRGAAESMPLWKQVENRGWVL